MKNMYKTPIMEIKNFSYENIVTTSVPDGKMLAEQQLVEKYNIKSEDITSVDIKDMFVF